MDEPVCEQAAVLALVQASSGEWYQTAEMIAEAGSAARLLTGEMPVMSDERRQRATELMSRVSDADVSDMEDLIERVASQGVRLITIVDEDYPENLKLIFNRPPFIWVRGELDSRSLRAIAVVGTRQATEDGRAVAARLARGLAQAGVTVLSGLARGIDTAAHAATLEAGGRTVAVIGNGILGRVYWSAPASLEAAMSANRL
jgi:DNA processing protein